jgi:hypothetical protein
MEDNHWYQRLWLDGVSVGTVDGLLVSAVGTGSLAAKRESRWLPSRYDLMHRWLPRQCQTLPQHVAFTAGVLLREALRSAGAIWREKRDLIGGMPRQEGPRR